MEFFPDAGKNKLRLLPILATGIILNTGKRTFASLGRAVLSEQRWKTSIGKFFNRRSFHSREQFRGMLGRLVRIYITLNGKLKGRIVFAMDGSSIKRGSATRVENALDYRKQKKKSKGHRSTKAHTFLMGLLLLPFGMRLPFTRYTYYTKKYCRKHKKRYRKQTDLALEMLKELRSLIPAYIKVVVVADNYFDDRRIFKFCRENNLAFIVPANTRRTWKRGKKRVNLHKTGRCLKDYQEILLQSGEEKYTAGHRRSASQSKNDKKRAYSVSGKLFNVSGLGDTLVVFSRKHIRKKENGSVKTSKKVLLCSDVSLDFQMVVEFYELRWQIEIFFRELKSELGLCDYMGLNFQAYERFVDLCLIAYTFLEWFRMNLIETTRSRKDLSQIKKARTAALKRNYKEYAMIKDADFIKSCKDFSISKVA